MEQKRQALEGLMNSTIICPEIAPKLQLENYTHVWYEQDAQHEDHKQVIEKYVQDAMGGIDIIKHVKKVVLKCLHVYSELGTKSLFFYIDKVVVQQIQDKATHLELLQEEQATAQSKRLRDPLPELRVLLQVLAKKLSIILPPTGQTPKLKRLLQLLGTNFADKLENGYRGIVFVEQVALVSALSKEINDNFSPRFQCGAVTGTGSQSQADREEQLQAFHDGTTRILVATAALEEGIDVSACQFVSRYSYIATTKGHIQGAGRARHPDAEIYYFENSPEAERCKERDMNALARNESLALSREELQRASALMRTPVHRRHPYPFGSTANEGEVNVFNCKQIFIQCCSRVLGQSISPKEQLYHYRYDVNRDCKVLASVRFLDGWQFQADAEVTSF